MSTSNRNKKETLNADDRESNADFRKCHLRPSAFDLRGSAFKESSKSILIAGLGNPLRQDDGIGIVSLDYLKERLKRLDLEFLEFGTSSLDIINHLQDYQSCIIIDAVNFGGQPGEVKSFSLDEIAVSQRDQFSSTHEIDLRELFRLYQTLKLKTPIKVIGIQPKATGQKTGLSPEVRAALPQILALIQCQISNQTNP